MAKKAKKVSVSKSQAIRDYMEDNPDDGPKAVSSALSKSGIKVSAAFVSTIKSMDKNKIAVQAGRIGKGDFSMNTLLQAKALADQMGGVERAKAALDALGKLTAEG